MIKKIFLILPFFVIFYFAGCSSTKNVSIKQIDSQEYELSSGRILSGNSADSLIEAECIRSVIRKACSKSKSLGYDYTVILNEKVENKSSSSKSEINMFVYSCNSIPYNDNSYYCADWDRIGNKIFYNNKYVLAHRDFKITWK